MRAYEVFILRRAQKELADLPSPDFERSRLLSSSWEKMSDYTAVLKLTGGQGWRIRIGDYRVIYEIDDPKRFVTVLHVGNRRDVYA